MAIASDVLVIGGGFAGTIAALAAARTGASVRVLTHKQSTLTHASGLIDVLGYAPGVAGPLSDPFAAMDRLGEDHPYSKLGVSAVREGLSIFEAALGDRYLGGHTDRNALFVTSGGAIKPTARYPQSVAAGVLGDDRSMLLVGFRSRSAFDGRVLADHLRRATPPFDVRGAEVDVPGDYRADARVTRIATALDRDATVSYEGRSMGAREALAEAVKPRLSGAKRVGFPALLGDERAADVRAELEGRLGAAVFEIPMGPPSYPGLRLAAWLSEALDRAGVRISDGNPAVGFEATGDRPGATIESVLVDRQGRSVQYSAEQFVLATGGLVGKGIDTDRNGVREPLFGCHVPHPEDRYEWSDRSPYGEHAFARFGVRIDEESMPVTAGGDPAFSNLRSAGAVIGGFDADAENSQSGVSLASGYVAGTRAGEAV
ncbi:MAG: glycerol-3-phosphate dehydrogenase subunit GlpB [Halobacteriota archaeon]